MSTGNSKRQRSSDGNSVDQASKKGRCSEPLPKMKNLASEVKENLLVALVDHKHPLGQMVLEDWKLVQKELIQKLIAYMDANPDLPMPSYDGAGWTQNVKLIKCADPHSLEWVKGTIKSLKALWEGADLEIVERARIPTLPKAKVVFPELFPQNATLRLLQRKNPDIPKSDWRVLRVLKQSDKVKGHCTLGMVKCVADFCLIIIFFKN